MFTGIVEDLGTVAAYEAHAAGSRLTVKCATVLSDLTLGASIAVNGVCLTATAITSDSFSADLAPETLARTNLGSLSAGARVNLERPVTPTTRLSGHIVQGAVEKVLQAIDLTRSIGAEDFHFQGIPVSTGAEKEAESAGRSSGVVDDRLGGFVSEDHLGLAIRWGDSRALVLGQGGEKFHLGLSP